MKTGQNQTAAVSKILTNQLSPFQYQAILISIILILKKYKLGLKRHKKPIFSNCSSIDILLNIATISYQNAQDRGTKRII